MKKLLSLVLAFALVLTSMSVAFASSTAPAKDIADEDVKVAVERLAALGIIAGKADGKFHEDDPLTREEFAKILALSVNLGKAAEAAKGTTRFSDVPATNWASGYINVAVGKGLILGRGDGTFGLGVKVTAEEAITMLVRALGYKDSWLEGTWPTNMVNLADEIGLLDDVDFVPGFATRGLAAQLVNAALSKDTVVKSTLGPNAEYVYGDSLLTGLGVKEVTATVKENGFVNKNLDATELKFVTNKAVNSKDVYTVVQEDVDVDTLVGREIECLINSDDEIILVSAVNGTEYVGTIDDLTAGTLDVIGLDGEAAEDLALSGAIVYVDRAASNDAGLTNGQFGVVVTNDDDEIVSALVYNWDESDLVVKSVDTDDSVIKAYDYDNEIEVDLADKDNVYVAGDAAELADIEANDVIYTANYTFNKKDCTYIYVVRNSVEGTLEKIATNEKSVTVDGEKYDVSKTDTTYSTNGNKDVDRYTAKADIKDLIDEAVTLILGIKGEVRHIISGDATTANILYGAITDKGTTYTKGSGNQKFVDVYLPAEEDTLSYEYDADTTFSSLAVGDIVAFTIDEDGVIDALVVLNNGGDIRDIDDSLTSDSVSVSSFDKDYDYMKDSSSKKYFVTDSSVLADFSAADVDDYEPIVWGDLADGDLSPAAINTYVVYNAKNGDLEFAAFTSAITSKASDNVKFAMVTDRYYTGSERVELTLADGTVITKKLNVGANIDNVDTYDIVAFTMAGDNLAAVNRAVYGTTGATGSLYSTDIDQCNITAEQANKITGNKLYTKDDDVYLLADDVAVYVINTEDEEATIGTLSNVRYNNTIKVITNADGIAKVIVVIK